jgi:hypothetical protein
MTPTSHELESPTIPGRFTDFYRRLSTALRQRNCHIAAMTIGGTWC